MLADEVSARIRNGLHSSIALFDASTSVESDIWAEAWSLPGEDEVCLILVYDAQELKQWDQLVRLVEHWRELKHLYMVFISTEPSLTRDEKGQLPAHLAVLRDSSQGQLVVCSHPAPDELVSWVCESLPGCSLNVAYYLVSRCGENLRAIRDTITSARITALPPTRELVEDLTDEIPQVEYIDSLIAGDKHRAMMTAPLLIPDELGAIIGLLDARLDTLRKLHDSLDLRPDEVRTRLGMPQFLITKYRRYARDYRADTCERRRRVLAMADAGMRGGARDGVPEFIAALW